MLLMIPEDQPAAELHSCVTMVCGGKRRSNRVSLHVVRVFSGTLIPTVMLTSVLALTEQAAPFMITRIQEEVGLHSSVTMVGGGYRGVCVLDIAFWGSSADEGGHCM